MNFDFILNNENEKPLDKLVTDGGFCGIMRTIACVGDSLSSGEFESVDENGIKNYHDMFDYSWGQYIARMAGCRVLNFSRGGMTAREYCQNFAQANGFWDKDKAAQGYIIALGVNDIINSGHPVGSTDDICLDDYNKNADTFAGNYGKIIQRYKEIQPDAKFFLVTKPKDHRDERNINSAEDMTKLLYDLAELFENTYVLDIREYGPINDDEFKKRFYLGGHLNAAGYLLYGKIICSYIDYIIRHDFEAFKQIGFVGTPYKFREV